MLAYVSIYSRPKPLPVAPGEESVWDYPRPPRLEAEPRRITVVYNGVTVIDTTSAFRVLETSHPPTYYLPPDEFAPDCLVPGGFYGGWVNSWVKGPFKGDPQTLGW
jgi:hypothetical protein